MVFRGRTMNELDELAKKYGTDKQLACHGYTKFYEQHFKHLRNEPINLLEIGVHTGASLQMWADYFPNAQIWGIDDGSSGDLRRTYENPRIHFREGSQVDPAFLTRVAKEAGNFDIILDDGSHYSNHIVFSFKHLFMPNLKTNGWYVAEDLHCCYHPYTAPGLAERFNKDNFTAIQFFNKLVDAFNTVKNDDIEGLSFYPQMCFIKKK
jgi:cephalosporin hydroxylase